MGYQSMQVEKSGEVTASGLRVPFVIGPLSAKGLQGDRGLAACLYHPVKDKSLYVFASAPAEVFDPSATLEFAQSLRF